MSLPGLKTRNRLFAFDDSQTCGFSGFAAGIDEAGRGPLAGPVAAAAVIIFRRSRLSFLNDSKKILPERRKTLFREISQGALIGVGVASEKEIDLLNIYQATRLAMKRAILALSRTPDLLLIDGNMKLDLPLPQKSIVGGDAKSACIAAASIIAKVFRDAWMTYQDSLYPAYRFKNHKGYATSDHLKTLKAIGPSPIHRRSFAPVHEEEFENEYKAVS